MNIIIITIIIRIIIITRLELNVSRKDITMSYDIVKFVFVKIICQKLNPQPILPYSCAKIEIMLQKNLCFPISFFFSF